MTTNDEQWVFDALKQMIGDEEWVWERVSALWLELDRCNNREQEETVLRVFGLEAIERGKAEQDKAVAAEREKWVARAEDWRAKYRIEQGKVGELCRVLARVLTEGE